MAARRPAPPAPTTTTSYSWSMIVYLALGVEETLPWAGTPEMAARREGEAWRPRCLERGGEEDKEGRIE